MYFPELNKYIDPSKYNHEEEPPEARHRLARAVLQEIPRQVGSGIFNFRQWDRNFL